MKDELHIYCRLEGINEEYLRAQRKEEKRLLRLEKKSVKNKKRSGRECKGLEYSRE